MFNTLCNLIIDILLCSILNLSSVKTNSVRKLDSILLEFRPVYC